MTVKARLHILLSRESRNAIVFRRGSSKQVCTFRWNRSDDTFTIGQWLRGRIYERRCDLSPDGKFLIYFAMNGRWASETGGSWTAISWAPYLKAISLWTKGDCWNGGGLFINNDRYWLNGEHGHELVHDTNKVNRDPSYLPDCRLGNNECLGVYYPRLVRDGWLFVGTAEEGKRSRADIFEKRLDDTWILRKLARAGLNRPIGKGVYYDEHQLINHKRQTTIDLREWEWADWDVNRLVWAVGGKLFASHLSSKGFVNSVELHDFNAYQFKRIKAPY